MYLTMVNNMLFRTVINHTKFLLKSKEAMITFSCLVFVVLRNFLNNVYEFQGMDITALFHPMKMLALSYNKSIYNADTVLLFVQLYPFLVAFSGGFSYLREKQTREEIYLVSRMGKAIYYFSRLFSTMLCTIVVFCIPFLIEIVLNCISFPLNAMGDFTYMNVYDEKYISMVTRYLGSSIYIKSPVMYAILATLFFGVISGVLSMFVVAISYLFEIKYRVVLLLPVYLLLNCTVYIDNFMSAGMPAISWYHYILLFDGVTKNGFYLVLFIFCIALFSIVNAVTRVRGDVL